MAVRSDTVSNTEIETARGKLPAYVSRPSQGGPWPGVVMIHDAFGMTTGAKRQVDSLASQAKDAEKRVTAFFDTHLRV